MREEYKRIKAFERKEWLVRLILKITGVSILLLSIFLPWLLVDGYFNMIITPFVNAMFLAPGYTIAAYCALLLLLVVHITEGWERKD